MRYVSAEWIQENIARNRAILRKIIAQQENEFDKGRLKELDSIERSLKTAPKILHDIGRWQDWADKKGNLCYRCSVCGFTGGDKTFAYCPVCGMKAEVKR